MIEILHNFGYKHGGIWIDCTTGEFDTTSAEGKELDILNKINSIIRKYI